MIMKNEKISTSNYINCMNDMVYILTNTVEKLKEIYYKYILYPKLQKLYNI